MASLKQLSSRSLVKILRSYGAEQQPARRGKGSHGMFVRILEDGSKRSATVPLAHKVIARGTLGSIRRKLKLTPEDDVSDDEFLSRA